MSIPRSRVCLPVLQALALSAGVLLAGILASPLIADDIVLTVTHGGAAGESQQTWSGGTSPYQLHRANQPQAVVSPAHLFGLAASGLDGLSDTAVPGLGGVFFYDVVSGSCGDSVIDLNETCDDGGALPGDGCSAVCQLESTASLVMTPGSEAFGNGLVGTPSTAAPFQVTNQGDAPTGALSIGLTAGDTGDFSILAPIVGDCSAGVSLASHANCTVRARFSPQSTGPKSATLTVSATPGGSPQATLSGTGQWPLTIDVGGTGSVTRDGSPVCVGSCPETHGYANGVVVALVATPQNGSNHFFSGWSGACTGTTRTCSVTMTQARSVTATFTPMTNNLAFVSSVPFATTLGSTTAYDAQCNALATAAGLNNATNNAYIAWISTALSSPVSRLGATARGWVRIDRRPIADTQSGLLSNNVVYHPIRLDELGVDVGNRIVMTATEDDGTAQPNNCFGWTNNTASAFMTIGDAASGSGAWSGLTLQACNTTGSIYCLMKTKTVALTPTPEAGKRIYLSGAYVPAIGTPPDQRCTLDKPIGLGTVKALVATTSASASAVLNPTQRYVRMDGIFIGTGADIAAGGRLTSGMWQLGTGVYAGNAQLAWTGAATLGAVGTSATTCSNWLSTASTALTGRVASSDTFWWSAGSQPCGLAGVSLYCVEQ